VGVKVVRSLIDAMEKSGAADTQIRLSYYFSLPSILIFHPHEQSEELGADIDLGGMTTVFWSIIYSSCLRQQHRWGRISLIILLSDIVTASIS
jgi:hypothetical protein